MTCFAPLSEDAPREWQGVQWRTVEEANFSAPGYWLIFRSPEVLLQFPVDHPDQWLGVVCQDASYPQWTEGMGKRADCVLALCQEQKRSIEAGHPYLKGKVGVVANGIRMQLIEAVKGVERNPRRIMWASSPDRGLLDLLRIFRHLREWVSGAELYIAYGWDNLDKLLASDANEFHDLRRMRDQIIQEADQPGVFWLGRMAQPQLMEEWAKTGFIVYPTVFTETFCSSICEAQAMGAIPVASPVWALWENTVAGTMIVGDPADPLVRSRFVGEVYKWMAQPDLQNKVRPKMMAKAKDRFNWERAVDLYEAQMLGYAGDRMVIKQFNFQLKHVRGSILNVGCADDPANLKDMGAINLDVSPYDETFERPNRADIVADCRDLPEVLEGERFESVVLGDILEHFYPGEVPDILRKAAACRTRGGRLVITVPNDCRPPVDQHSWMDGTEKYLSGESVCHRHPITMCVITGWLKEAGLIPWEVQVIDYGYCKGWGVVAQEA